MLDAAAGGLDQLPRMLQEERRIGARPARVGRREMAADVARAEAAEQRVGDRMQADVGIGMADQPQRLRQPHAAQHEAVARCQAMDVEALPDARREACAEQPRGAREVVRRGDLEVALVARHHRTARPAASASATSSVRAVPGMALVGGENVPVAKPLRRLRPDQPGALDRAEDRSRPPPA